MRTGIVIGAGAGTGAGAIAGGATVIGAGGAAGTTAAGATIAVACILSQQLVELVDLHPANKKGASAATKRPTGQRAKHFVYFIVAFGLCGLRFVFQQKCGDAPCNGKRKGRDYFPIFRHDETRPSFAGKRRHRPFRCL
jgi:hypothetical protein